MNTDRRKLEKIVGIAAVILTGIQIVLGVLQLLSVITWPVYYICSPLSSFVILALAYLDWPRSRKLSIALICCAVASLLLTVAALVCRVLGI